MASQFGVFRKYQKASLVAITLLAMVAFVVADPLIRYMSTKSDGDTKVVEVQGTTLTNSQVSRLVMMRKVTEQFVAGVIGAGIRKMLEKGELTEQQGDQLLQNDLRLIFGEVFGRMQPTPEGQAIETKLLADRGAKMHVVTSDAAINEFLGRISRNNVTGDEVRKIIGGVRYGDAAFSESQVFDALRTELTAFNVWQMQLVSALGTPPAQRFDYYSRIHRKAVVETIALPVSSFVDKAAEPTSSELAELFEQFREAVPVPGSVTPGFKQPAKRNFQYVKAELDLFEQTAAVTDEEIETYYEKNKRSFFKSTKLPSEDAGKEKPDAAKAEPDAVPEEKPAEEPAVTPPSDALPKPEPPSTTEPKKSSSVTRSPFRLVADNPADPTPTASAVEEKPAEEKPAEAKTTEEKPAEEKPAATTDDNEFESLDKVRDQIKKTLTASKSRDAMNAALDAIKTAMGGYARDREANLADPARNPEPKNLDLAALAKGQSLKVAETGLLSVFDLAETELGKSGTAIRTNENQFGYKMASFPQLIASSQRPQFSIIETSDTDGNSYVAWEVDATDEKTLTLDEAKPAVVDAFKLIEARKLAKKQAESLQAEAVASKLFLSESFVGQSTVKVARSAPFSWFSRNMTPADPNSMSVGPSIVPGLPDIGEEFFRTVFNLPEAGVGTAFNASQTVCYVVQPVEFTPDTEELAKEFATQDPRTYASLGSDDVQQMKVALLNSIERDAGLRWLRAPRDVK